MTDKMTDMTLTGRLFLVEGSQVALISLVKSDDIYWPLFSTIETLERFAREFPDVVKTPIEGRIKQIRDAREFLTSSMFLEPREQKLRLISDPYLTPERRVRYHELFPSLITDL